MEARKLKAKRIQRRKYSIRNKINGTQERLRLTVYKSISQIYAQIINDDTQSTLVSASSIDKEVSKLIKPEMTKIEVSNLVGKTLAERAASKNIKSVAFDRNGRIYHGRIKALAEGARQAGLEF